MKLRYTSITALTVVSLFFTVCISQFVKRSVNEPVVPEIAASSDIAPSAEVPDTPLADTLVSDALAPETPADAPVYSEEEATLSVILNLYEEALDALGNGDKVPGRRLGAVDCQPQVLRIVRGIDSRRRGRRVRFHRLQRSLPCL